MREMQAEDHSIGPVVDWLTSNQDPSRDELRATSMETRNLWSQRPQVFLENGILVRAADNSDTLYLVVPQALRFRLFQQFHAGPLSAHLGAEKTLFQLKQTFYWPGMRRDTVRWCQHCLECAQSKGPPTKPHGKLHKVLTGAPMDLVAIDILSGLPETPEGYKYLLVVTDYFTKWSECYALKDAEAPTCMRTLYNNFFARFGLPRSLHSDQGRNFESKLFAELCKLAGINKCHTTAFHPQFDGQTERMNRTILNMLWTTADDNPANWPQR